MPYILEDFEGVSLPPSMSEDDLGAGSVETALRDSIGGVFDAWGAARRLPRRRQFAHRGRFVAAGGDADGLRRAVTDGRLRVTDTGAVRVTALSAVQDLEARTDALKGMVGVRGRLWRRRVADGQRTWKLCRLLDVRHVAGIDDALVVADIETGWETADVGWRSAEPVTVQGTGASVALGAANAGTVPIEDAVLSVAHASGTITQLDVRAPGVSLRWSGALAAGQVFSIDCGRQTVTVNGGAAYSGLSFQPGHEADGWLPLRPGVTQVQIDATGGTVTASIAHYDQWA